MQSVCVYVRQCVIYLTLVKGGRFILAHPWHETGYITTQPGTSIAWDEGKTALYRRLP